MGGLLLPLSVTPTAFGSSGIPCHVIIHITEKTHMKITLKSGYRSESGTATFVYFVDGTTEELKKFKEVQKDNFREDEETKKPLYWSIEEYPKPMNLLLNRDGDKFYVDAPLVSKKVQDKVETWKALALITGKSVEDLIAGALGI